MDSEKVIKELHDARRYLEDKEWSDRGASPHIDAINDALEVLKAQRETIDELISADKALKLMKEQAVEPIPYHRSDGTIFKYECRQCRTKIFKMDSFCRRCGQAVKWNA